MTPDTLTRVLRAGQHRRIIGLYGLGRTRTQIAQELAISPETVKSYLNRITNMLTRFGEPTGREALLALAASAGTPSLLDRVQSVLGSVRPLYMDEAQLQQQLARVLEDRGFRTYREYRLSDGWSRIDLVVFPTIVSSALPVGVEVKVDGSHTDVLRQLERYAATGDLDGLILATTRARHYGLPSMIDRTPLRLVSYVTAGI